MVVQRTTRSAPVEEKDVGVVCRHRYSTAFDNQLQYFLRFLNGTCCIEFKSSKVDRWNVSG